jgi:hypothetical protein
MQRIVKTSWALVAAAGAFVLASSVSTPAAGQTPADGQSASAAQAQQPPAGRGGRGGGSGGGRGGGRGMDPSELRSVPAEQMAAAVTDPNWRAPRTPWGHPDLQGTFTSDDMRGIPADRPQQFGTRELMTSEEFLARARSDEASRFSATNQESFLRNEFGVRTFSYTSLVIDPPDGRRPPLTDEGRARRAPFQGAGTFGSRVLNTFDDFSLYDRCISRGVPDSITPVLYGNGIRIVQSPDTVALTYEMIHDTRMIMLGDAPRPGEDVRPWVGISRGHFEGDTLVVETTNFHPRSPVGGGPSSPRARLTEWFTRVDPEMIEYRYRVDDPGTFAAPYTVRMMLTTQPDYDNVGGTILEYACHEGNSAVEWGLRGERYYEKIAAEAEAAGLPVPPRPQRSMDVYGGTTLEPRDVNRSN